MSHPVGHRWRSHYDWLQENLGQFIKAMCLENRMSLGIISAHGDKCYQYRDTWNKAGVPFEHGVALYFLTYLRPWSEEVRDTNTGWVKPDVWVIDNYPKFKDKLPPPDPPKTEK